MTKQLVARLAWGFVILLIVISALFFISPYLSFNSANSNIPLNTAVTWHFPTLVIHAVTGGLALLLGPFQFLSDLRTRRPLIHRIIGRIYVGTVVLGGLFALFSVAISTATLATRVGFGILAVLWLYTIYRAYTAIRQRQIQSHRIWMIRNYALTLAAITLRLWLLIGLTLLQISFEQAYTIAAWLSWSFTLIVAEWFIVQPMLQPKSKKELLRNQPLVQQPDPELV